MSWVKGKVPRIMRLTEVGTEAKKQQATGSRDWNAGRTVNLCCFSRVCIYLLQYSLKTDSAPGKLNPHYTDIFFSSHRQFTAPVHVTDLATCRDSSSSPLSQSSPHSGEEGGHPVQQVTRHIQWIRTLLSRQPTSSSTSTSSDPFAPLTPQYLSQYLKKKKKVPRH